MPKPAPREIILNLFSRADDGLVSGGRIGAELGISRTAVWKHICSLRDAGYRIESVPARGYRLTGAPDSLLPEAIHAGLDCLIVGAHIRCLDETDSTNLQACRLGDAGEEQGLVVIADSQTAGKGRMGRSWESPPGVNLYASVLLRPPILPFDAPRLTFLSAVAVCRAIQSTTRLEPTVKWPNDVLLDGAKVAGLLNEMSAETDRVNYVVLGIGVNLNMTADQFPGDLRYPATSLAIAAGRPVSRLAFTRALLREIDRLYRTFLDAGSAPILAEWTELCAMTGKAIEVDCGSSTVTGTMAGLAEDGALLVRTATGKMESVYAGDVRPSQK